LLAAILASAKANPRKQMKTKQIITPLIVLSLVLCASASRAATIISNPGGGNWHSGSTWVGGVVPSASDDAVITPAVNVDSTISIQGLTINGGGTFFVGAALNASGDLTLNGTATVQQGANVTIGGNLNISSGTTYDPSCNDVSVTGDTSVSGILKDGCGINSHLADVLGGNVTVNLGGVWQLTDVAEWSVGGNIVNNGSITVGNNNAGITFTGSGKTISGNIFPIPKMVVNGTIQNGMALTVATALSGSGTFTVGTNTTLTLGGTATVGTLDASASPNTVTYSGAAQTVKAATYNQLTLSGSNVKTFSSSSTVNGDLTISSPVRAAINSTVTVAGTTTANAGATLSGTGTLNGATVVNGTIAPGPTIGTLTLGSNPTLNGATVMEINRTASPNADSLTISGNPLTYGGTLTVNNLGPALVAGNTFQLFSASSYSGAFGTVTLPTLTTNLAWTNTLASNGAISVVSTLAPGKPNIFLSSSGTNLVVSWDSTTFPGYSVQAQTNSASVGLNTNWSDTGSGTVSPYSTTIDPANQAVFLRLVHP
jgi:hypothetical protein